MRKRRRRTKRSKIKDQIKAIQCLRSPTKRTTRAKEEEEEDRKKRTGRLHGTARRPTRRGQRHQRNETRNCWHLRIGLLLLLKTKTFSTFKVIPSRCRLRWERRNKVKLWEEKKREEKKREEKEEVDVGRGCDHRVISHRRRKKSLTDRLVQCPKSLLLTAFNNRRGSGSGSRKGINWPLGPFHQQHQMTIELTNKDLMMPRHRHDMILLSAFFPSFLLSCLSSTALTPSSILATVCLLFFSSSVHLRFTIFRCQTNKQRNCLRFQFVYARNPLRWFDPCKNRPTISSYWSRFSNSQFPIKWQWDIINRLKTEGGTEEVDCRDVIRFA